MSFLERLTSLFAPDSCLGCSHEGSLLCARCHSLLPPLTGYCFGCKRSIPGTACAACLAQIRVTTLTAASHYSGVAKLLVACLKFRGNQSAAHIMAAHMLQKVRLPPEALLVHMPATNAHIRERGFDQAQLLSRHLSRVSGLQRCNALQRQGKAHQLGANRQQRLQLGQLDVLRPGRVCGRHIIVIDDVLTTGSSLAAAAAALHKAGAARVDALVFAQALK